MNRSTLYKHFRCILYVVKPYHGLEYQHMRHQCLAHYSKPYNSNLFKLTPSFIHNTPCRKVFSSNLTNSDAKSNEHSPDELTPNSMDNEEFQDILKDFAKDFGLGSDSEQVLEDIKKSLEESSSSTKTENDLNSSPEKSDTSSGIEKYKEFNESDSVIIHSYEELNSDALEEEDDFIYHVDSSYKFEMPHIPAKRGITGVFDIDELVEVLRRENLMDIVVISIPFEIHYADFLVVVTAKSPRHSKAVAEYLLKLHKMKKHTRDPFIKVEGEKVANWKVLDMGNIVIHIFLEETRAFYDIESLWLFDADYDSGGTLKPDPLYAAMEEQMAFFNSLQETPTETTEKET